MTQSSDHTDIRELNPELKPLIAELQNLKRLEKYDEGIEKCKIMLETRPEDPDLHVELGDLYYEKHFNIYQASHTVDDAITQYQYALEMLTNSAEIHYKLGKALMIKGEFDKAINHLKTAIKHKPEYPEVYTLMGIIEAKRDNLGEAEKHFQQSLKLESLKSSAVHFYLHMIAQQRLKNPNIKNRIRHQIKSFNHFILSIILFPFDKPTIRHTKNTLKDIITLMPSVIKAQYHEHLGSMDKAISIYSSLLEKAVGFSPLYITLGDAYKKINRLEDAINEYRMAIWINPANLRAYKNLCNAFEEIGDYDSAIKNYRKLLYFKPNDAVLYSNLANILYMKGDVSSAISAYQTAIVLNPNKTWTSVVAQTLGYVFQESKGDYDAAISAYQSATLLNPNDVDIYISLGSAFFDKGDLNNALAAYRSALEINPDNAKVHCNMGYLLWGKSAIPESIAAYNRAIELDPDYDIAYNNLGVIYLDDLGNLEKAVELFNKAIEINPNYALAYYNVARSMSIKGDKIEAARLFQLAIDLNSYTNELDPNEIKDRIARLFDPE